MVKHDTILKGFVGCTLHGIHKTPAYLRVIMSDSKNTGFKEKSGFFVEKNQEETTIPYFFRFPLQVITRGTQQTTNGQSKTNSMHKRESVTRY